MRAGSGMPECGLGWQHAWVSSDLAPEVSALAIKVTIPEALRWDGQSTG
jgi:hypothetical protein